MMAAYSCIHGLHIWHSSIPICEYVVAVYAVLPDHVGGSIDICDHICGPS